MARPSWAEGVCPGEGLPSEGIATTIPFSNEDTKAVRLWGWGQVTCRCASPRAALTNLHNLGALKRQKSILSQF